MNADQILELVRREIEAIRDPLVREGLSRLLVSPSPRTLAWDYGPPGQTYAGWMVAVDGASGIGIAWCDEGFGPQRPWGLVSLTNDSMGMDSGWFCTLREAFMDSFAAGDLEMWVVVRRDENDRETTISSAMAVEAAYRIRDEQPDARRCYVVPRSKV